MEKKTPFKELSTSQKIRYIYDYYKIHILIVVAVIALLISLVYSFSHHKENLMNVLMINFEGDSTKADEVLNDFMLKEDYNTNSYSITTNTAISVDVNSMEYMQELYSLNGLMASSTYSGFFSDEETFMYYANQGYFINLEDIMSEELIEKYKDYIIYGKDFDTNDSYPCGIRINTQNCNMLKENEFYKECIFGFITGDTDKTLCKDFIEYVLD